mmetsp:Transcript_49574/g.73722  ORF Transcript_49574/g.73722 Transcript_49574/m.73722 type:complete len:266 (+) Transcript_49574:71-868(+)
MLGRTIRVLSEVRRSLPSPNNTSTIIHRNNFSSKSRTQDEEAISRLLTIATARQLKGDISDAISFANQALTKQREQGDDCDSGAIADTTTFLGKLFRLDGQYDNAEESFREGHSLYQSVNPGGREEYIGLVHIASIQSITGETSQAEESLWAAAKGLEELVGWSDGMTNHAYFELSELYKGMGRKEEAVRVLSKMKAGLVTVFGSDHAKAVQINCEMAEIKVLLGDIKGAMELLEEVGDILPPNSPEARRAFLRLEDLKEEPCGS